MTIESVPAMESATSDRTLVVDPTFGVAGDMLMAALVDAGADESVVRACVDAVLPDTVELRFGRTTRSGLDAATVDVVLTRPDQPHRPWREVRALLEAASGDVVPSEVRTTALRVFAGLARAEGAVHGVDPEDVHFHEVGAWDSIADVVGVCAALHSLGVERLVTLPISVGSGAVRVAHGLMPVPVPAVLELLSASGLSWQATPPGAGLAPPTADDGHGHTHEHGHDHGHPHGHGHTHEHGHDHGHPHGYGHDHGHPHGHVIAVADTHRIGELATPTGVAVLAALAEPIGETGARRTVATGVGAGRKDFTGWPNIVRVAVTTRPEHAASAPSAPAASPTAEPLLTESLLTESLLTESLLTESLRIVEANLDDVDPRVWPSVLDGILAAGARDTWLTPVLGKKGRSGHTISALVASGEAEAVVSLLLRWTGTLGVREYEVTRHSLRRAWAPVTLGEPTPGEVRVKYGHSGGRIVHATPEYEDCARVAELAGVPVLQVLDAARAAADAAGLRPGASCS